VYSDVAIETALTLRLLFRLPLRQTECFLPSLALVHKHTQLIEFIMFIDFTQKA
jgi:hypothetical protein